MKISRSPKRMLPLESKWVTKPATRRVFTASAFMRSGCHGGMINAGLSPATRTVPIERISETKRERHTSPRAWAIRVVQQRAEGLRLAHDGLAMQADGDEVLHRLDVVLFELVPGQP